MRQGDEKSKAFKEFVAYLGEAYIYFHVNQLMHEKLLSNDTKYTQFQTYWALLLRSTQSIYLIRLAGILKPSDKRNELTIYSFLDYKSNKFDKHKDLLDDLKKLRNKYLVHLDSGVVCNLSDFLAKLDVKREKYGPLFVSLIKEVFSIAADYGCSKNDLGTVFSSMPKQAGKEFQNLYRSLKPPFNKSSQAPAKN